MNTTAPTFSLLIAIYLCSLPALAGQSPSAASSADIAISHHDRVYAAEQFSNTVSVIDPAHNTVLGVIRFGEPSPANFSPLYRGPVLVHGVFRKLECSTRAAATLNASAIGLL